MITIGCNEGVTSYGKELPDGGVALFVNENLVFAIAEERLSRIKHAGSYRHALEHVRKTILRKNEDIDRIVFSSCCDYTGADFAPSLPAKHITRCGHHESHALGSAAWSGFDRAIILVMDSGGDCLSPVIDGKWWASSREQHSIFLLDVNELRLIARHADEPFSIGFGEFYRSMTYFLGWRGARYAGNTMAAGALGSPAPFSKLEFFHQSKDLFVFPEGNNPLSNEGVVRNFLLDHKITDVNSRFHNEPFSNNHFDLAAWLQCELDRYTTFIAQKYCKEYDTSNFIITGGVGYNCVAAGRLQARLPSINVFVQPASGDIGQCVGNAIRGIQQSTGKIVRLASDRVDLGARHSFAKAHSRRLASKAQSVAIDRGGARIVKALAEGKICALYQGRSEYGPRALGFRSIVALASIASNRVRLNELKSRNYMMPVAPIVRHEDKSKYFRMDRASPYMTMSFQIQPVYESILSACGQGAGWSRVQTVSRAQNEIVHGILSDLDALGEIPVLLNTSLNGPGEPIIERTDELVEWCERSQVNCAWVNGLFFDFDESTKSQLVLNPVSYDELVESNYVPDALGMRLGVLFPHLQTLVRERFLLRSLYIDWVVEGRKKTTIRFKHGAVEYPIGRILPLYSSNRFERFEEGSKKKVGQIIVSAVVYKSFYCLDEKDAIDDGFKNLDELKRTLVEIYPSISKTDIVSIFHINVVR
jgi:carbamoyltransferase